MSNHSTTILVVGAGKTGAQVLRQLSKNPRIKVVTLDPRDEPHAVKRGIIKNVDFKEALTPLTLDHIIKEANPDLILLTSTSEDMGLGQSSGVEMFSSALRDELATLSDVPVIEVTRTTV
jgi:FlaA1/EpsC-like NDP-sugar epimerase